MENDIYNRKMIEKRFETLPYGLKTVGVSSSKENSILISPVTHVPKSPTRYIKTQSIYPQEQSYPSYPSHWTNSTHPITTRVGSPNSVLTTINVLNGRRPEIIELGGSR
jgi:hypothetical protein